MKREIVKSIRTIGIAAILVGSTVVNHFYGEDAMFIVAFIGFILWLGSAIYEAKFYKEYKEIKSILLYALLAFAITIIIYWIKNQ